MEKSSVAVSAKEPQAKKAPVWPDWYKKLAPFRRRDDRIAAWQVANTLIPYAGLWYLLVRAIERDAPLVLIVPLILLAAAFLVRLFILFHDCVHGSLFQSRRANSFFGHLFGILVFTSFEDWRFSHLRHHATYANLDSRGFGDIWTMTLKEYLAAPRRTRLLYRLYRHPLVVVGLGALFNFILGQRFPSRQVRRQERASVIFTNLALVAIALLAYKTISLKTYLAIQIPVLWTAGAAGISLFFVQHQFPGGYWARTPEWDPLRAALEGSSFLQLPAILRWFSGSIGYHHIHHLNPTIPNYRLKSCFDTIPQLRAIEPLTLRQSLACFRLKLWDEEKRQMVGFPKHGSHDATTGLSPAT
ncbi:omega-6 fatty acid desaturase (delta-12 desaturase) [Geothermobacter ehrlichii]|uniref:Omega-6 fatty acid desaturase (Delta-12 desaturase) n=1 Tax=Geothermobacter ehrlichii TaxID=213224 RepID=A0A5D3WI42_9BACT|nr:fatty acid desaturase [Geothermobacter ehrlichii]TYO97526.1 omega-6 fatty acid desaturase (delta-12 desaturase) [Geothermobacter ehrlichii]